MHLHLNLTYISSESLMSPLAPLMPTDGGELHLERVLALRHRMPSTEPVGALLWVMMKGVTGVPATRSMLHVRVGPQRMRSAPTP